MSTTPVWVPLLVAAAGVASTLSVAFLTRRGADRREDQRWRRDHETEETRWQREQDERREQWRREDHARWLTERRAAYAEFLLGLETWRSVLLQAQDEKRRNGSLSEETVAKLESLEEQSNRTYETISVLVPQSVVNISDSNLLTLSLWSCDLTVHRGDDEVSTFSGEKDNFPEEYSKRNRRLREAIRQDLGVD
jgi:hypothetical protein